MTAALPDPYALLRAHPQWTVDWNAPLPAHEHGRWYARLNVFLFRRGLTQVERRSALAHEMEHAQAEDHDGVPDHVLPRQETLADQGAARRLLPLDLLAEALAWSDLPVEVAEHCQVTERLLLIRIKHLHPTERAWLRRRLAATEPTI